MDNEEKRRPGRPRSRPDEEPGQFVGFRAPRELKNRLEATAAQNGRSISTEAQFRLEQSFRNEDVDRAMDMAYGPQTAGLVEALGLDQHLLGPRRGNREHPPQGRQPQRFHVRGPLCRDRASFCQLLIGFVLPEPLE